MVLMKKWLIFGQLEIDSVIMFCYGNAKHSSVIENDLQHNPCLMSVNTQKYIPTSGCTYLIVACMPNVLCNIYY